MECICKNGATCHVWNGACMCTLGWRGPACDVPVTSQITLSIDNEVVPLGGTISFISVFTNVDLRGTVLELDGVPLYSSFISESRANRRVYFPSTVAFTVPNATFADSGKYRCYGHGYDENRKYFSNFVEVTVKGCKDNVWGKNCSKKCDCANAYDCTQFEGCQCVKGWTGDKCEKDIEKPVILDCPPDIDKLLQNYRDMVNVTWQPISATDNDGIAKVTSTYESGHLFTVGTSKVIITAYDHWNNSDSCAFTVTANAPSSPNGGNPVLPVVIILLVCGCVFFLAALCVIIRRKRSHSVHRYSRLELDTTRWKTQIPVDVRIFQPNQLQILDLLGEGMFSKVYRSRLTVTPEDVRMEAVKMPKDDTEYSYIFLQEIQLLEKLKDHPNVIQLTGVVLQHGHCCIITELMRKDLLAFLKERTDVRKVTKQLDQRLLKFALHIARALEHLENQQVVHRDIAARNILISPNDIAKIADFGLSRDVYQKGQYQRHPTQGMLVPIRWMSPESLVTGVYTKKSDIWSYGVMLWEMVTLGDTPYPEFQPLDSGFLTRQLSTGYRMPKPCHCTDDIYGMMRHCWRDNPDERPTAAGLVNNITRLGRCNKGLFLFC
ncbi:angiopoietin-1 receptor-like [Ptychodera flava]|uniref:angiopoietin-1 receptor-like n=1 Tax=Ptychodera flava TaxID=63121 RepID=UPI00396AAB0A